jgi:hypothetical protein
MDEDIIVTLKRSNDLLMTFGNDYSDVFLPAIDEIERLRSIIKKADAILEEKNDHWSERIEGARNALFEGLEETR